jgi:tetratricopeptide (TPR) repeat protein
MNPALCQWREEFGREPVAALDRLVRGVVPLGDAGQLSLGEVFPGVFAPGDAALDAAVCKWLSSHLLAPLPAGMTPARWAGLLEELFRGISTLQLAETGRLLREQHTRLRLWLRGLYAGPDRDPEAAYLLALAYHQTDQAFSRLWRRLVLGAEMPGRPWRDLGLLGFRKMPEPGTLTAADAPLGLLQALAEWAERPGVSREEWQQSLRSLFALYQSTEDDWVRRFQEVLDTPKLREGHAALWLGGILPNWQPAGARPQRKGLPQRRSIEVAESLGWVERVARDSTLCGEQELAAFLERHRAYARATGDSGFLAKTFNNLASRVVRADRRRAGWAISRLEEALAWEPADARNWTAYAQALWAANRRADALAALWQARQRFAWNPFVRTELAQFLREQGDVDTAAAVFREAAAHFPTNVVCRAGLAQTLRALGQNAAARAVYEQACRDFPTNVVCRAGLAETLRALGQGAAARAVYEQACRDFPTNIVCRNGLADLLLELDDLDAAERYLNEARQLDQRNAYARSGLAEVWFIRSARANDPALRDRARELLAQLAAERNLFAPHRLRNFDERWARAVARGGLRVQQEIDALPPRPVHRADPPMVDAMSPAERLGRAMIALWHAGRAGAERAQLCAQAERLLDLPPAQMGELLPELLPGFVETRGLVWLARGDARRALGYFTDQIERQGRGGWLGVRLGEARARLLLGQPAEPLPDESRLDSRHARFALRVVAVIRSLGGAHPEPQAAELLRQLYPEAARLADQWATAADQEPSAAGDAAAQAAGMIAVTLREHWFGPAQITSPDDFADAARLKRVLESIRQTTPEVFDVLSNTALALPA